MISILSFPARLNGYHRYSIKGRSYPAIFPKSGSFVEGKLWTDITEKEIRRLIKYETDEYELKDVDVFTMDAKNEKIEAKTFVFKSEFFHLLYGDWSYDAFLKGVSTFLDEETKTQQKE